MLHPRLIVLAGLLSLAGCAATPGGGAPSPSAGGGASSPSAGFALSGTVYASPGCPGPIRLDSPCPDRPVAGAAVEVTGQNVTAATTTTDGAGRFTFVLPAGTYQITARNVGFASRATKEVVVTGSVDVTLVVDSGLR